MPGDIVVSVDGTTLDGLTVDAARDRIRGPKGSVVKLDHPARRDAPIQLTITRDIVQIKEVESQALAGGTVGYIGLSGFSDAAADEVVEALKAHLAAGRTKLILDLRGNPGRLRHRRPQDRQPVHRVGRRSSGSRTRRGTRSRPTRSATASRPPPTCASSSSSMAAAPRPARSSPARSRTPGGRQLVGQQSFGKGTVQQWQELSGEGGAFKLTIARWLTPDKRWIHNVGLTPDVVVTLPRSGPGRQRPDPRQGGRGAGRSGGARSGLPAAA